jgi:hypothetical protein
MLKAVAGKNIILGLSDDNIEKLKQVVRFLLI